MGGYSVKIEKQLYDKMPADIKQHFKLHHNAGCPVREFPPTAGQKGGTQGSVYQPKGKYGNCNIGTSFGIADGRKPFDYGDSGSAARFFKSCPIDEADYACLFYCAKSSKAERNLGCGGLEDTHDMLSLRKKHSWCNNCDKLISDSSANTRPNSRCFCGAGDRKPIMKEVDLKPNKNNHPTVKPLSLMRYLVRLVTPLDGMVLDPFAGSGTTLMAAKQEGFKYVGIELGEEYAEIAKCRVNAVEKVEKVIDEIQMSLEGDK